MYLKWKSFINVTKASTPIISSFSKTSLSTKKWTFWKNSWESSTRFSLQWLIQENYITTIFMDCWQELKRISLPSSMNISYMKDSKMPDILLAEDRKCFSGKSLFGEESQLENKAAYTLFIRSSSSCKNKLSKMSYKRKIRLKDSKSMKPNSSSICIWTSITMIKKTLLWRTFHLFVLKKHWKLHKRKA